MQAQARIERALHDALGIVTGPGTPPALARTIEYAVFPGGARVRPRLVLAVADACASHATSLLGAAAAAIELMHCASLIQDDLQCFDAADTRRGRSSVHQQFGAALAILASDALIVGSFDVLATDATDPATSVSLIRSLSRHTGASGGITAGQAWEQESSVEIDTYHAAKTGSLFEAATELGALCAGVDPQDWLPTGRLIGVAYQVADDLADALESVSLRGKPGGVDSALARPNIALEKGITEAADHLHRLVDEVIETLPFCPQRDELRLTIRREAERFIPEEVGRHAA